MFNVMNLHHKPCNSLYIQANLVILERGQHG